MRGRLKEKYSCHRDGICDGDCVMTPTTWSRKLLGPRDVMSLQAPATVGANARAQARASARKRRRTGARKYAPPRARNHEIIFALTHQTPHQAISVPPSTNPLLVHPCRPLYSIPPPFLTHTASQLTSTTAYCWGSSRLCVL